MALDLAIFVRLHSCVLADDRDAFDSWSYIVNRERDCLVYVSPLIELMIVPANLDVVLLFVNISIEDFTRLLKLVKLYSTERSQLPKRDGLPDTSLIQVHPIPPSALHPKSLLEHHRNRFSKRGLVLEISALLVLILVLLVRCRGTLMDYRRLKLLMMKRGI